MFFKLSNLNSNLALILGYLNPALNNSALTFIDSRNQWRIQGRGLGAAPPIFRPNSQLPPPPPSEGLDPSLVHDMNQT